MARHRDHDEEAEPAEVLGVDPGATWRPRKQRGPLTALTERLILELCTLIAEGRTLKDAAALVGTNDNVVQQWLKRGREAIEQGAEPDVYTALVVEYEAAAAHFRAELDRVVLANIGNRSVNEKYIRWRLAVSDPKGHTLPREGPAPAASGLGPLFEMVTPEQARVRLEEKLTRFLGDEARVREAMEAPPPAAAAAEDEESDDGG